MYPTAMASPDLLTVRDVARRLSISERTVWRWTALGLLPAPVHPHTRSTRWRAADIERYLQELSVPSCPGDCHDQDVVAHRRACDGANRPLDLER